MQNPIFRFLLFFFPPNIRMYTFFSCINSFASLYFAMVIVWWAKCKCVCMCACNGPLSSCYLWSLLLKRRYRHRRCRRHFSWLFKKIFIKDSAHLVNTSKFSSTPSFNFLVDSCNLIMRFFCASNRIYILHPSHCPLCPFFCEKNRMILLKVVECNEISSTSIIIIFSSIDHISNSLNIQIHCNSIVPLISI